MNLLNFVVDGKATSVHIGNLVIAGWTGRNADAIEKHIAELEAIGVKRPRNVPCFYLLGANLLSTDIHLDAVGENSSGEAEFVLISTNTGLLVGLGSDHTDREVEKYKVTVSKQMCPKPIGNTLWTFEEVRPHWDRLILRSWVTRGGVKKRYQEGTVAGMLTPEELIKQHYGKSKSLPIGTCIFCGTLPVHGKIEGGERFDMELEDPVLKRAIRHGYEVRTLAYAD
ncbi:MAG: DUF2848 domain-containing protein [Burkholderiales bacterium]|nr:DUF2848 domain-containing protein [Burkholderiales bacterium]